MEGQGGMLARKGWLVLSCSVLCAFNSSPPALLKLTPHLSPSSSLVIVHPGDLGILLCHQELTLMLRMKVSPRAYQYSTLLPIRSLWSKQTVDGDRGRLILGEWGWVCGSGCWGDRVFLRLKCPELVRDCTCTASHRYSMPRNCSLQKN